MKRLWGGVAILMLAGCQAPDDAARDPGRSPSTDGPARGELLSLACQACHSLSNGGEHLIGPNLHGIFGRKAGTAAGYAAYSPALLGSGIVWSPAELNRWLENPANFLPGTTMAFTGYRDASDRQALIDYLLAATGADAPD